MLAPKNAPNEANRIAELHALHILDTLPEERFDRVTRIAKRLFNVPIVAVTFVDEHRQWFKSCVGLDATETPRDISFCGHAILGDDTFYIPDATKDERFFDNPLVVDEPFVRFYAGHPFHGPTGEKLGTLCLIDAKPREFSEEDKAALIDLALMLENELIAVQMATVDDLTDISNRRGFQHLVQHTLKLIRREKLPCFLAFLDLDDFKPINDQFGHDEGDRALKIFAQEMKNNFRDSDVFARIGGDEFVVVFANTTKKVAEEALLRFRQSLAKTVARKVLPFELAFTFGISEYDENNHTTLEAWIKEADTEMYRNKHIIHQPNV